MRVNHDYHRRGAVAYLAANDVHQGRIQGRCEDTTGIAPFGRLVQQVMSQEPYKSADRVFWTVDNASSHRGKAAINRLTAQPPNAIDHGAHPGARLMVESGRDLLLHHPAESALAQQFQDLDVVVGHLADFEERYNQAARPFKWKFTTTDLADLIDRIDHHRPPITSDPRPTQSRLTPDELTALTT